MSSIKRSRGRPRGTGLDDTRTMSRVADMLVANSSLKPTTAIKSALDNPTETAVRRLQGKWKDHGNRYLADARARQSPAPMPTSQEQTSAPCPADPARRFVAHRQMQDALNPTLLAAQQLANSSMMMAAQAHARQFSESSAQRALEEFQRSPTFQIMRDLQSSPAMQAILELHASPAMRAIQEMQTVMRTQMQMLGAY